MFTGLVEARVRVLGLTPQGSGARLALPPPDLADWAPVRGESIAVSGCCLSVVEIGADGGVSFDLSRETLDCTRFGGMEPGELVNLERALRLGDRLGGHLVSGHVDGVGEVAGVSDSSDGGRVLRFRVPAGFERYLVAKGSVTVDGVSLTVVDPSGREFDVAVIPETLERTSLGDVRGGERVHLEADQVGKWIERLVRER